MRVAVRKDRGQPPLPKAVWVGRTGQRAFEFTNRQKMYSTKTAKEIRYEQLDNELFRYCGPIFVAPALNS
jgi:hypothetical protein